MQIWNKSQRAVLALFILIACAVLAYRAWHQTHLIPDPEPPTAARASELITKLNPNTAPWEQLAILPNLSEERAKKIIAYRTRYEHDHPNQPTFTKPEDLLRIPGIGVAMLETLEPYFVFGPQPTSTTRP
jgi:hypothetical protein